ncbi:hypothetical protein DIPPA_26156 [Diplonema papillatum]|nr:hypothetical protein DIPPA_26156 [Diplonema papillatum]
MEWKIDRYIRPEPPTTLESTWSKSTGRSPSRGQRRFWGSTRASQFETESRKELKAHQTRRGVFNCTGGDGVPPRAARTLDEIWQNTIRDLPAEAPDIARRQMMGGPDPHLTPAAGSGAEGVGGGSSAPLLVLDPPAFRNCALRPSRIREMAPAPSGFEGSVVDPSAGGASFAGTTGQQLMSVPRRREALELEAASNKAVRALGEARKSYKRLAFIARHRHPNGVLSSESVHEPSSDVYRQSAACLQAETSKAALERTNRQLLLSSRPAVACDSTVLRHEGVPDGQRPPTLFQRKKAGPPDLPGAPRRQSFSVVAMAEPVPLRRSQRRLDALRFASSRGRTRDLITGHPIETAKCPYR